MYFCFFVQQQYVEYFAKTTYVYSLTLNYRNMPKCALK